jgi:multidrug resistance protein MdtO
VNPLGSESSGDTTLVGVALEDLASETNSRDEPAPDPPAKHRRFFVEDAWTNPSHSHFAFKATLAAMLCYTIYTSLDWWGIHTAMITAILVVQGSSAATLHKSALRITGCLIGGLLGLGAIIFVVPRMQGITELVLVVSAVSFIAAWVTTGTERLSYVGLQLAIAFFLSVMGGPQPETNLDTFRNRLVGILLGVVVTGTIFAWLWPERATDERKRTLASAVRLLSTLIGNRWQGEQVEHAWSQIRHKLTQARKLAETELFESWDTAQVRRTRHQVDQSSELALRTWLAARWRNRGGDVPRDAERLAAEALGAAARRIERGDEDRVPQRSREAPGFAIQSLIRDADRIG